MLFQLSDDTVIVRRIPENPKVHAVWHVLPEGKEQLCYCKIMFPAYDLYEKKTAKEIQKGDKFCAFCFPKHFSPVAL